MFEELIVLFGLASLCFWTLFSLYVILKIIFSVLWENYVRLVIYDINKHQYAIIRKNHTSFGSRAKYIKSQPMIGNVIDDDSNESLRKDIMNLRLKKIYDMILYHGSGTYEFNHTLFEIVYSLPSEQSRKTLKYYPRLKPFAYMNKMQQGKRGLSSSHLRHDKFLMILDFLTCSFKKIFVILQRKQK